MRIREFDHTRDSQALSDLFIALQDFERRLVPGIPEGSTVAGPYIELMLARCRTWDGRIFVADSGNRIVGFVCVWARMRSDEPDDGPSEYAFVSDLIVDSAHRGRGVGRMLMSAAEHYAGERGSPRLRVRVLARNIVARGLYRTMGFSDYEIELEKRLRAATAAERE